MTLYDSSDGDAALAASLRRAGSSLDADGARAVILGVISALAGRQSDCWLDLIAPGADAGLRAQLKALKESVARTLDYGFTSGPAPTDRIAALRDALRERDLAGFIVPRGDAFQSEYVPQRADRMRWLTGFSGSAGLLIIFLDKAAIFVDGRYSLQVRDQVDVAIVEPRHLLGQPPQEWIAANLSAGGALGYDPWLHAHGEITSYEAAANQAGGRLVPVADNPVDAIWATQPAPPIGPVNPHPEVYAGVSAAEKRQQIADALKNAGHGAAVIAAPDSLAWLLNIRGSDVINTPLPMSYGVVRHDGTATLFIDRRKLLPDVTAHLGNSVSVLPIEDFPRALGEMARQDLTILIDRSAPVAVAQHLAHGRARVSHGEDPCALPKACKNPVEVEGARQAHIRDGVAMARFLAWFAAEAPRGGLTEMNAAERILKLRQENDLFQGFSFGAISGAGPNGALPHYRVTPELSQPIRSGQLYLLDSGGQYLDGTTDVTRTLVVGDPTDEMRDRFTRVLKGHIALAIARFPDGTTGTQLDVLARRALWDVGLDFDHGTGHGVGSYLNVHEGPQRIAKALNTTALKPGMIVSNEPGYYRSGAYGIRIENLITVVSDPELGSDERPFLRFETLTLAPIDLALIDWTLLTDLERHWLNNYHQRVREVISPQLDHADAAWLADATRDVP